MQTLAIFVILGVGADDVFVLNDSYENLRKSSPDLPIETRLRESLVHTAQAVLNTSFTSTAAFLACGVSPIMPIATFGIYTAICIILNYAFAMTLTPAALVINEMYVGGGARCYYYYYYNTNSRLASVGTAARRRSPARARLRTA